MGSGTSSLTWGLALTLTALVVPGCRDDGAPQGAAETDSGGSEGDDDDDDGSGDGEMLDPEDGDKVSFAGARRLSRHEYDNVLESLIGESTQPGSMLLPEDQLTPFDNDIEEQIASFSYVEAAEAIARESAERLVLDPERMSAVLGCTPTSNTDAACMESFVASFGRRALRRALADEEIAEFVALGLEVAGDESDFDTGAAAVVTAMLLDTEFLYRIERGTPVDDMPGVFALDGYEVATRLSFLLTGTTPSDTLLDAAEAGDLDSPDGVRAAAEELLATEEARRQVDRFHALWLGYHKMPVEPELALKMRRESRLLLEAVVFDDRSSWLDVFTATGTYVGDTLAEHYGLPTHGSEVPQWVDYGDTGRAGLLSHGTFLSVGGFTGATSPTKRGKLIRTRLMCGTVAPPPPDVDADAPPPADGQTCKEERYAAHNENPVCAACHEQMDPIGFGLEAYDYNGQFRTHDPEAPACDIAGEGEVSGVGTFSGPGELAALLIDNDLLDTCAVAQLYRYAMGRQEDEAGVEMINELADEFEEGGHRFDALLLDLVSHPAFSHRREEA